MSQHLIRNIAVFIGTGLVIGVIAAVFFEDAPTVVVGLIAGVVAVLLIAAVDRRASG